MSKIRVHDKLQKLCYLFPTFLADVCCGIFTVDDSEPLLRLPFDIPSDIVIIRLCTPQSILVRPTVLNYVNSWSAPFSVQSTAQMGIRKPPNHLDGNLFLFCSIRS